MWLAKIKDIAKFLSAYVVSSVLKRTRKYKDVWIITERRAEAKDNGYHFFCYIRENYPEQKVYYAIDKHSKHLEKIVPPGNAVAFNGFRHYVLALAATRLIGAFLPCGIPDSICFYKFPKLITGKKVFLQHGITMDNIPSLSAACSKVDLFICGAEPEYDFILKNFGYKEEQIAYTGFARYDALMDCRPEKMILLMPTWRQYLPNQTFSSGNEDARKDIIKSEYFQALHKLICNQELESCLKKSGYKLLFYPHHETQWMLDCFLPKNDCVILAREKEYDVQQLLKKCALLITDYSSVAFDVAYMRKPIVYYQFDQEQYHHLHYPKGYYEYERDGFGPVETTVSGLVHRVICAININCEMEEKYKQRADGFFTYHDQENCKRIYAAIQNLG